MVCGMRSSSIWSVLADDSGYMKPDAPRNLIIKVQGEGKTPLYVSATTGKTVRGSFDPFEDIHVCKEFCIWMQGIDASWVY